MPPIERKTCPPILYEKLMDSNAGPGHCGGQNESLDGMNWALDDTDSRKTEEREELSAFQTKPQNQFPNQKSVVTASQVAGNKQTTDKEGDGSKTDTNDCSRPSRVGKSAGMFPARFSARFLAQRKAGRKGRAAKRRGSEQKDDSEDKKGTDEALEDLDGNTLGFGVLPVFAIGTNKDYQRKETPFNKKKPANQVSADLDDQDREGPAALAADVHPSQHCCRNIDNSITMADEPLRHTLQPFSFTQVANAIIAAGTKDPFQKEIRIRIKDSVLKGTEVCIRRDVQKLLVHFTTQEDISFIQLTTHCDDFKSYLHKMLGIGKRRSKRNKFGDFYEIEVKIEKLDQLPANPFM